ncbi:DUF5685 family protein [Adlercreutzia sp. R21]|uniref:DUF5685 family protein n=1 Tax=Adlercreutzia wanghongyangiae TaxID=3111451 RepID=A0ABU6IIV3_9ACTN|nr:DUF5685 family protein [Adlercreutzia sp. R21]MEC4176278.1 DUF5685 family protein [Adlercreutzia sp. R7]MEC4184360.1 DUF5685 family protein [Adlercreutzia sp. R21]
MFGFVVADAGALSEEEKDRYRAVYCGLCLALRDRYGQLSRTCLTYDLTFFVLLCNSLHEPAETQGASHCIVHPAPAAPRAWARSTWTDYAADLSVALAYHKVLDDVHDDGSMRARAAERLLAGAYERARARISEQCAEIERAMAAIRVIEDAERCAGAVFPDGAAKTLPRNVVMASPSPIGPHADEKDTVHTFAASPDAAAQEFGRMLGRVFSCGQGFWAEGMEELGRGLGRFVYLMDAAVDFADDAASGSYNPFVSIDATPDTMRTALALAAADVAEAYERLPLVQDAHLMDAILYSGMWAQFNQTYPPEEKTSSQESAESAGEARL